MFPVYFCTRDMTNSVVSMNSDSYWMAEYEKKKKEGITEKRNNITALDPVFDFVIWKGGTYPVDGHCKILEKHSLSTGKLWLSFQLGLLLLCDLRVHRLCASTRFILHKNVAHFLQRERHKEYEWRQIPRKTETWQTEKSKYTGRERKMADGNTTVTL